MIQKSFHPKGQKIVSNYLRRLNNGGAYVSPLTLREKGDFLKS